MASFSTLPNFRRPTLPSKIHSISHCFSRYPFAILSAPRTQVNVRGSNLRIRAIDAAQPYDYEAKINDRFEKRTKLKIAIVGFGNFGQFLAKTIVRQGHTVLVHSRSNYSDVARELGVVFFSDPDDLCEEHPEKVVSMDGEGLSSFMTR
uniref:Pyrroline-5-carboxylate reductase catalytic N-terminal domain-containing protein n=1 Tax=Nelumbo nucifera TaxID=4432 RepID=A0A822ZFV9_NELNU|nr:TPA_asm: hypothetical protein HUJ06_003274 [Nelumbo nucifera]